MSTNLAKAKALLKSTQSIILLVTLLLMVASYFRNDAFFSTYNMATLFRTMSFTAIVGLGQTLVLLLGDIDLSCGAIACLTAIFTGKIMTETAIPPIIAVIMGLGLGAICGLINCFLISKFKINAFIITLGMSTIYEGIVLYVTGGSPILNIPEQLAFLGKGMIGGFLSYPLLIMLIFAAITSFVLKWTPFGRQLYAIGGNETAAKLVGIKVDRCRMIVFMLSGIFSALAGLLMMLRLQSAQPSVGLNWLMPSITAAVLGGTSMSGGRGTVVGTVLGALLMTVISNAIVIMGISTYLEDVVIGTVVIIAVLADALRIRFSKK